MNILFGVVKDESGGLRVIANSENVPELCTAKFLADKFLDNYINGLLSKKHTPKSTPSDIVVPPTGIINRLRS